MDDVSSGDDDEDDAGKVASEVGDGDFSSGHDSDDDDDNDAPPANAAAAVSAVAAVSAEAQKKSRPVLKISDDSSDDEFVNLLKPKSAHVQERASLAVKEIDWKAVDADLDLDGDDF